MVGSLRLSSHRLGVGEERFDVGTIRRYSESMIYILILGYILSGLSFVVGLWLSKGWPAILLIIGGIIGVSVCVFGLYGVKHDSFSKRRVAIYNDLRSEHWNIKKLSQISGQNQTVEFNCITLSVKKLAGKYRIVVPRAEGLGGGYKRVSPLKQKYLERVCAK